MWPELKQTISTSLVLSTFLKKIKNHDYRKQMGSQI